MTRFASLASVLVLCATPLAVSCTQPASDGGTTNPVDPWAPGEVLRTATEANPRGLLDRRGLIHAHSFYSHDACDGEPHDEMGTYNEPCLDDFRAGLCSVQHDFVFLTDHGDSFADNEFPDTLLYRPAQGDSLVERAAEPVASWLACEGQEPALVMAGNESEMMPVGLERHVAPTPEERNAVLGSRSAESIDVLHDNGAVVLLQHTEQYDIDTLVTLPVDGFEMFNLHANMYLSITEILDLTLRLSSGETEGLPHSDLVGVRLITEDPAYLSRWGTVLSRGHQRVTTMGTDCHRNSFPGELPDGERIDSYRRMMLWFSNHLLVEPDADGAWDDRHLKEALAAGRLYGAFEMLGYPDGFDFVAKQGSAIIEMGGEVDGEVTLEVTTPVVRNLDPDAKPPEITTRLLRAIEGGWEEVASTDKATLTYDATEPGAYRAEVRMVPHHLEPYLGGDRYAVLQESRVWVYANAIYVR